MRLFLVVCATLIAVAAPAQDQTKATTPAFPGTYAQLKPQQKKLIDEWYAEYDKLMHENDPPTDYDQLSLSTRTTFEAVTHALMTTNLTSKSGQSMGEALDLVQSIETIHGKIPQARGDLQFRVYVILRPEALQTLKDSTEFFRDRDNTVYHHGYPLNWRQDGGAPSIQISMAPDGRHADIDVDYRSSKFPQALLNGHLTAANSDVRAGGNTQRHLQRWQGLSDWWRNLFGLDIAESDTNEVASATGDVPPVPLKGAGRFEDAVLDFLNSWLLQGKPEMSAAYLSTRSYSCLEEYGPQSGNEVSGAAAPYLAAKDMAAISKAIGKPANLQDAVAPYPLNDSRLKPVKQQYGNLFSMYAVPNGVAPEFECDDQRALKDFEAARLTGIKKKYNRYYAAVFRLEQPPETGQIITLLWTKEGAYWKVVAWDAEPEDAMPLKIPDTRRDVITDFPETNTKGDSALLQASDDFLRDWLLKRNYVAATQYFSPRSYSCIEATVPSDQAKPTTPAQYLNYMQTVMQTVSQDVGNSQQLVDVIEASEPEHPGLKRVKHKSDQAYALVAVSDTLAPAMMCEKESKQHPYQPNESQPSKYGDYYDMLFELRTPGEHPASLSFLWGKDDGQWKIISYEMMSP
jgi:hypothetical protein